MNKPTLIALTCTALLSTTALAADVTYERLLKPEPQNWLQHHNDFGSQRFSALDQINKANAKNLRLAFTVPLGGKAGNEFVAATPLVDGGYMYISDVWGVVYKIDVRSGTQGKIVWKMDPGQQKPDRNRGVALWGDMVISVTGYDGRIIATNTETGQIVWDKKHSDNPDLAVYAARRAADNAVTVAVINKNLHGPCTLSLDVSALKGNMRVWRFDQDTNENVTEVAELARPVAGPIEMDLPAASASMIVITPSLKTTGP